MLKQEAALLASMRKAAVMQIMQLGEEEGEGEEEEDGEEDETDRDKNKKHKK